MSEGLRGAGPRVLVVDDDEALAEMLHIVLRSEGFEAQLCHTGSTAVTAFREYRPDLVLLDLMLPGRDGIEICREVRAFSSVPIIMVTARIEEIDRLLGLELGADDYICKPFSPREMVARVKAVLRRSGGAVLPTNGLILDDPAMRASLDGRNLDLTAVEFKLLALLASRPGHIYHRAQLMERIYPDQRIVNDRTIDSHIKKLRRKMELAAPGRDLIHSVYGVGYKYEADGA